MIIDKLLELSSQQALTGTSAIASTNVINLGSDRDIGPGEQLWLVVVARVGLGGTSNPTIKFDTLTDDNSGFSSAATLLSQTLTAAQFVTGTIYAMPMALTNEQYLGLQYTMTGTSPTATVDAFLTNQPPTTWRAFPDAL